METRNKTNRKTTEEIIDFFAKNIEKKLISYIEPNASIDEFEEKASNNERIPRALLNKFKKITHQHKLMIRAASIAKNCQILLDYFNTSKRLFGRELKILRRVSFFNKKFSEVRIAFFLEETIDQCKKFEIFYSQPSDTNVYKVVIPKEIYRQLYDASERFWYEGRATAVAKASIGGITSIVTYSLGLVGIFLGLALKSSRIVEMSNSPGAATGRLLAGGVSNYGYSCISIMSIPPEWIEGIVQNKELEMITNDGFFPSFDADNNQIIYVLDANNPEKIWRDGIVYENSDINPHGRLVFFHKIQYALHYAQMRNDGSFFDRDGGWCIYDAWEEEQRDASKNIVKEAIATSTQLPEDLVKSVDEYLHYRRNR